MPAGPFVPTEVPARVADLACRFDRPSDWVLAELPPELPDFAAVAEFAPLVVAMAPFAALVFSVGARPVYGDGTLSDWLGWLAREAGYDPGPIEAETGGSLPAVACWAMQFADGTPMRMRLVLAEDGGRLIQLAAMAPQSLWSAVHETFRQMLGSFVLLRPRGSSTLLAPAGVELPASSYEPWPAAASASPAANSPTDAQAPEVAAATDEAAAAPAPAGDGAASDDNATAIATVPAEADADEVPDYDPGELATFAAVALADDPGTLSQDDELNQRLLQSGAGFAAPLAVAHGRDARCADVRCGALLAVLRVPYGWRVLDDSRRTLVHDGDGGVQIQLDLRRHGGWSAHEFLRSLADELRTAWPELTTHRLRLRGVETMLVQGLLDGDEPLAQTYMLRPAGEDRFLVVRTTCRPADLTRAGDTAELLLHHVRFVTGDEALPVDTTGPLWWQDAQRRAASGDLEAAERLVLQNVPHLGAYAQLAELHERLGRRHAAAGDQAKADAAFDASCEWMDRMASSATSGGEGMALSLQRDEHRRRLGR